MTVHLGTHFTSTLYLKVPLGKLLLLFTKLACLLGETAKAADGANGELSR